MKLKDKINNVLRGLLQRWGTSKAKRALWNKEFSEGRWAFMENTPDDPVYRHIERYCKKGTILDLGCGSGNTGNELSIDSYQQYTGVDISDIALQKARQRTQSNFRFQKNSYFQADISTFASNNKYDVILFRESIFYIARPRLGITLDKYAKHLTTAGVFIVRMTDRDAYKETVDLIERKYEILERFAPVTSKTIVIVFRPPRSSR